MSVAPMMLGRLDDAHSPSSGPGVPGSRSGFPSFGGETNDTPANYLV